jgi:hypothetical protein
MAKKAVNIRTKRARNRARSLTDMQSEDLTATTINSVGDRLRITPKSLKLVQAR